ncbi:hypothetical protein SNS2_5648 [Streptomyces netropsis]|nr:hypothetical protein SNS2_5648 [Streptomyces netropsis]
MWLTGRMALTDALNGLQAGLLNRRTADRRPTEQPPCRFLAWGAGTGSSDLFPQDTSPRGVGSDHWETKSPGRQDVPGRHRSDAGEPE